MKSITKAVKKITTETKVSFLAVPDYGHGREYNVYPVLNSTLEPSVKMKITWELDNRDWFSVNGESLDFLNSGEKLEDIIKQENLNYTYLENKLNPINLIHDFPESLFDSKES